MAFIVREYRALHFILPYFFRPYILETHLCSYISITFSDINLMNKCLCVCVSLSLGLSVFFKAIELVSSVSKYFRWIFLSNESRNRSFRSDLKSVQIVHFVWNASRMHSRIWCAQHRWFQYESPNESTSYGSLKIIDGCVCECVCVFDFLFGRENFFSVLHNNLQI